MKNTPKILISGTLLLALLFVARMGCKMPSDTPSGQSLDSTVLVYDTSRVELSQVTSLKPDTFFLDSIVYINNPIDSEAVFLAYNKRKTYTQIFRDTALHLDLEIPRAASPPFTSNSKFLASGYTSQRA